MGQKLIKSEDILKDLKPLVIDYEKRAKDNQERYEKALKDYNEAIEKERNRFDELKCPVCKSLNKKETTISENNGVIGSGYHSHITLQYLVCQDCGVMYKDINKPEKIHYPSKNNFLF